MAASANLAADGMRETLARPLHRHYLVAQRAKGQTPSGNPSIREWDELPESLKRSNRRQADHIGEKLRSIRCAVRPLGGSSPKAFRFADQEIEQLAKLEHERWNAERLEDGWTYAAGEKDIERKTSPHILPWEALDEEIRESDRDFVRGLPLILAEAGLEIYRLDTP